MIPLQPRSIKFTDDQRKKLRTLAQLLHWSEAEVVRLSVETIFALVENEKQNPILLRLAREARSDLSQKGITRKSNKDS